SVKTGMITGFHKMSLGAPPRLWFASSLCLRVVLGTMMFFVPRLFSQGTSDPPQITAQPQDRSVSSGATVTLSVSATGAQPLGFRWRVGPYGGTPTNIANATSATLVLTNVSVLNAGFYSVVVTNAFGSATSSVAHVTVDEDLAFRIVALQ